MSGRDIDTCWWCRTRPATTREHRIKRSRLEHEASLSTVEGSLTLFSADSAHPYPSDLKSTDAKAVKFGKTLCLPCNSKHSQTFDDAYQCFTKWAFENREFVRSCTALDWDAVFSGKEFDQRHLVRYYLKNFCCRLIEQGYDTVPEELSDYLDDLEADPCFSIQLYKDFDLADTVAQDGMDNWFSPYTREAIAEHPDHTSRPAHFHTVIQDGFIGVLLSWYAPEYRSEETPINIAHSTPSVIYQRKSITWAQPMFDKLDAFDYLLRQNVAGITQPPPSN